VNRIETGRKQVSKKEALQCQKGNWE